MPLPLYSRCMAIKLRLSEIMDARKIKPFDLVRKAGIAQGTAYSVYKGEISRIDFGTLNSLCEYLRVPVGELLVHEPDVNGDA